jgi:hypothetical protein
MGRACIMYEKRTAHKILRKSEGTRPLGSPRHRCVDIGKLDLIEIGWNDMDWIVLAWDKDQWRALVNLILNICIP